ncbi:MAG: ATP-binding protein [Nostocaceae cyanobacterium]|nr:ATP-binding protein [Nostocaceae cyanobacterium]
MSITAKSQKSNISSPNLESMTTHTDGSLSTLGAELVYKQDASGRYLSFFWHQSDVPRELGTTENSQILNIEQIVNDDNGNQTFVPVDASGYLQKLQQILTNLVPEKYQCWFSYHQHWLEFELVISPIMPKLGSPATEVLVMGRLLQISAQKPKLKQSSPQIRQLNPTLRSQKHQQLINQVTKNLVRTLNLDIIWQQAVDSLGSALQVERCIIFPYQFPNSSVKGFAEYHHPKLSPIQELEIDLDSEPGFAQALTNLVPVVIESPIHPQFQPQKILVVATCHQEQPNGLIAITLCDECYPLTDLEMKVAKELADHLGTTIAHATLYQELEIARQQAEEATRRKSEFLANVSHELRTPLNGMMGFLKLILDGMADDPQEQREFLEEAYGSSVYLHEIINDILDIAKIEAGKIDLELRSVLLDEIFCDVEGFIRPQAEGKNLSLQMQKPDTCDEIIINGDYQRLKQVMLNLLGNALKFTHEGGITVSAEVVRKKVTFQEQQFPGMVRVRVADTGIGVSLDKQDKLFQLFSQVDGSRTRQYGGTGLGLAISQKLIEAMGGEVNFYSLGEGLGSTVTFTVPLYQQPVLLSHSDSDSSD